MCRALFLPQRGRMSLATGEGEDYPIAQPGRRGRLLPQSAALRETAAASSLREGACSGLCASSPRPHRVIASQSAHWRGDGALPRALARVLYAPSPFRGNPHPRRGDSRIARRPTPVSDTRAGNTRPYAGDGHAGPAMGWAPAPTQQTALPPPPGEVSAAVPRKAADGRGSPVSRAPNSIRRALRDTFILHSLPPLQQVQRVQQPDNPLQPVASCCRKRESVGLGTLDDP